MPRDASGDNLRARRDDTARSFYSRYLGLVETRLCSDGQRGSIVLRLVGECYWAMKAMLRPIPAILGVCTIFAKIGLLESPVAWCL